MHTYLIGQLSEWSELLIYFRRSRQQFFDSCSNHTGAYTGIVHGSASMSHMQITENCPCPYTLERIGTFVFLIQDVHWLKIQHMVIQSLWVRLCSQAIDAVKFPHWINLMAYQLIISTELFSKHKAWRLLFFPAGWIVPASTAVHYVWAGRWHLWLTLRVRVVNRDINVKHPGSRFHIETQWRWGPDCGQNHQRPAGKCWKEDTLLSVCDSSY